MIKDLEQNFLLRHIGPSRLEIQEMLDEMGFDTIDGLIQKTIPKSIQTKTPLNIGPGIDEFSLLKKLRGLHQKIK